MATGSRLLYLFLFKEVGPMELLRVYIIDDHTYARKGLVERLRRYKDRLEIVGDTPLGFAAVDHVRRQRPDVVLIDVKMANGEGIQTCRALKQTLPSLNVIVLTSFHDESEYQAVVREGADAYILKNPDTAELLNKLLAIQPSSQPLQDAQA